MKNEKRTVNPVAELDPENCRTYRLSKGLREDSVGFYMTTSVVSIQIDHPLIDAYDRILRNQIGNIPVLEGNVVCGIISNRILLKCAANRTDLQSRVGFHMEPAVIIKPHETIYSAIERMRKRHARCIIVVDETGNLQGLLSQSDLLEVSRRLFVQAEERTEIIQNIAKRDDLTELYTRRIFERVFSSEFKRVARYGGLLALLILDLDCFKLINDVHGHAAGDLVLGCTGRIIRDCVRHVDVACRYGGDEFVILMPECGTRAAAILGKRIREQLEYELFTCAGENFNVTISGGACKWESAFKKPADMFHVADKALYSAKEDGRNRIVTR